MKAGARADASDTVFSVYMLRCGDGSLYTGIATDVERRIGEHHDGVRGAKCLRGKLPLELVFQAPVGSRGDASRLEHRIKRLKRGDKESIVAGTLSIEALEPRRGAQGNQASGSSSG